MAQQGPISMPGGGIGGIVRYDAEYSSKFMIAPTIVMGYVIALLVFVFSLRLFFPGGL